MYLISSTGDSNVVAQGPPSPPSPASLSNRRVGFIVSVITTAVTLWNTKLKFAADECHHKLGLPFLIIPPSLSTRTHNEEVLKRAELYRQQHFI